MSRRRKGRLFDSRRRDGISARIATVPACLAIASLLGLALTGPATAVAGNADAQATSAPVTLLSSAPPDMEFHGIARAFAPRWKASYTLGTPDDASASPGFLRSDPGLLDRRLVELGARDRWRHFLGLEFAPAANWTVVGGIAKSNGPGALRLSPAGYGKLRLSAGARWSGEDWGLDGSFSFIPTGANRIPGDAGFLPSVGDSGPTWLVGLALSRRF